MTTMSSQPTLCRLCLETSHKFKSLYDEHGRGNELHEITTNYFHPMILNLAVARHLRGICLDCWHHIWDFHNFQKCVVEAQSKLADNDDEDDQDVVIKTEEVELSREIGDVIDDPVAFKLEEEFVSLKGCETSPLLAGDDRPFRLDVVKPEISTKAAKAQDDGKVSTNIDKQFNDTMNCPGDDRPSSLDVVKTEILTDEGMKWSGKGPVNIDEQFNVTMDYPEPTADCIGGAIHEEEFISLSKLELIDMYDDDSGSSSDDQSMTGSEDTLESDNGDKHPDKLDVEHKQTSIALPELDINEVQPEGGSSSDNDMSLPQCKDHQATDQKAISPGANSKGNISEAAVDSDDSDCSSKRYLDVDQLLAKWMPRIKCVVCSESWPTFNQLHEHFLQEHPHNKFYILCCNRKFPTRSKIEGHLRYHQDPSSFKCEVCGRCLATKKGLILHLTKVHPHTRRLNKFLCPKCDKGFTTKRDLSFHFTTMHNTVGRPKLPVLKCNPCGFISKSCCDYSRHRWIRHKFKPKLKCKFCNKPFRNAHDMQEHIILDNLACSSCPMIFEEASDLTHHRQTAHPQEADIQDQIESGESGRESADEEDIPHKSDAQKRSKIHRKRYVILDDFVASWIPSLVCKVCYETFSKYSVLHEHFLQQHPLEKCYIYCCNRKLSGPSSIEQHLLYHNDPQMYKCVQCNTTYTTKGSLNSHIVQQHPETRDIKPKECSMCNKRYTTQATLDAHYRKFHGQYKRDKRQHYVNVVDTLVPPHEYWFPQQQRCHKQ